jgi:hypothetical protein
MTPVQKPREVRELQPVDITRLKPLVSRISEDVWMLEDSGKENTFACFHHTRHIVFRFIEGFRDHRVWYDRPLWAAWQGAIMPLLERAVAGYGFHEPAFPKVMLARLAAGYGIDRHVDGAGSNLYTHKIHIPLQTSEKAVFQVNDRDFHLAEGIAYEVNNLSPHAAFNGGEIDRIHLIFEAFDRQAT